MARPSRESFRDLAHDAEAALAPGARVNERTVDTLPTDIDGARSNEDFTRRADRLLERDKEFLERLAE